MEEVGVVFAHHGHSVLCYNVLTLGIRLNEWQADWKEMMKLFLQVMIVNRDM